MQSITESETNFYRAAQNITQKAYTVYTSRQLHAQATLCLGSSSLTSAWGRRAYSASGWAFNLSMPPVFGVAFYQ